MQDLGFLGAGEQLREAAPQPERCNLGGKLDREDSVSEASERAGP